MNKEYDVYVGIEGHDVSNDDCWNEEEVVLQTFGTAKEASGLVGDIQAIEEFRDEIKELENKLSAVGVSARIKDDNEKLKNRIELLEVLLEEISESDLVPFGQWYYKIKQVLKEGKNEDRSQ